MKARVEAGERCLCERPDLDAKKLALWGDSFAPVNPEDRRVDERRTALGEHRRLLGTRRRALAALPPRPRTPRAVSTTATP